MQKLLHRRVPVANMNMNQGPAHDFAPQALKNKNAPSPVTYPFHTKDERRYLSTKKKPEAAVMRKDKIKRFIDIHTKSRAWVPAANKYNYTS